MNNTYNYWIGIIIVLIIIALGLYFLGNTAHAVSCGSHCSPTPTPTATPIPTATPTPTPKPCNEGEFGRFNFHPCVTPTPSVTPTATPSATPTPGSGTGNVPSNPSTNTTSAPGAATCNIPFTAPVLNSFKTEGNGSVTFGWSSSATGVDKFSIRYGYVANSLVYGEDNVPSTSNSLTINSLIPGNHVWAIVSAWRGGCAVDSNILDPKIR